MLRTSALQHPTSHNTALDNGMSKHMAVAMPLPLNAISSQQSQQTSRIGARSLEQSIQFRLSQKNIENVEDTQPASRTNDTNDDDIQILFDVYESPCAFKASNDAFSSHDVQEFTLLCSETFFGGCTYDTFEEIQNDLDTGSVVEWTISFDYEVYYTGDPVHAVDHLETIILNHLSESTGLNGCPKDGDENGTSIPVTTPSVTRSSGRFKNFGKGRGGHPKQFVKNTGYRRNTKEYIQQFSDEEQSRIVAISSGPRDILDPDYNYCIVPVPSSISNNADCLPVVGAIHLYLNTNYGKRFFSDPNTELSIQSGLQRLIRLGMQEGMYASDDIVKHVSFIGTRISLDGGNTTANKLEGDPATNGVSASVQRGDKQAGIIIGVVGAIMFIIMALVFLAVREKRNSLFTYNETHSPKQGDEMALSGLSVGVSDEENPYLIAKAPLRIMQVEPDAPFAPLPSMVTADTMFTDMEDEDRHSDEGKDCQDATSQVSATVLCSDEVGIETTGEIEIFHDDDEDDEKEGGNDGREEGKVDTFVSHNESTESKEV
ncbi:hypothetical protein IV203_024011 [Nitzschia inconspicua]|uniref:Uncharacterized protein n=1 Tax=Nitzschia inconspicua TaxID=303405 RepID=A0A9K3PAP8_9STRA|nr:hypothetical protein IV203_024551 [Nitzschia inconspicua]KAG7340468.1 hypothetical protein IV203_024011 [Nitzschia inconspicua]